MLRPSLLSPFQVSIEGSRHNSIDVLSMHDQTMGEKFVTEKCELFPLLMAVMAENRDLFRHLVKEAWWVYTEVHLVVLTNCLLDQGWTDGLTILLNDQTVQQLVTQISRAERDKYIGFLNQSLTTQISFAKKDR